MTKQKDTFLRIRADRDLRRRINKWAKKERITQGHFLREAALYYMRAKEMEAATL